MLRLIPLLAFALLPAAVAAPVPPGGRTEFGANGLLSRADLEKVRFDTCPARRDRDRSDEPEPPEPKRAEKAGAPPRPKNRYDVAVHLPWATFREGEPVPAYFVLRNNRDLVLGLNSRMDFSGPTPSIHGGGCSFDVRDRATGRSVLLRVMGATNCGGGSLVDVPADGFYCVRADLNRLNDAALPPGEYEVDWSYGRLAAAPARFTVAKADGGNPAAVARRDHPRFYHLTDGGPGVERAGRDEPFVWRDGRLNGVFGDTMGAALAVGQHGVYVPDVHTVPTADKLVEAWVEWKPYREGDRVAVTLRAAPPYKQVRFAELPQLFLQIDAPGESDYRRYESQAAEGKLSDAADHRALVTPLTVEAFLPKDWRGRVGVSGPARVAVLAVAKRLEYPRGNQQDRLAEKALERHAGRPDADPPPVWSGVVRTAFTDLQFPPPPLPVPER